MSPCSRTAPSLPFALLQRLYLLLATHLFFHVDVQALSIPMIPALRNNSLSLSTPPTPLSLPTPPHIQCIASESWLSPNFIKEDCYVAVQNLYKDDFRFHPDEVFTFFSGGFAPIHRSMMVQTPRRYVASTCTLAIVNFNTLTRIDIPGNLPHGDAARDRATYREIYDAARAMEEQCVARGRPPGNVGWAVAGGYLLCFPGVEEWR
ncbi:MAG: hypothetical protein Q9192_008369 [Flavoplaca navasiana]